VADVKLGIGPGRTDIAEVISHLKESPKFLTWGKEILRTHDLGLPAKHYSLDELWGVSPYSIRRIFRDEPGVLKIRENSQKRKRSLTLRIPESVVARVHMRLRLTPLELRFKEVVATEEGGHSIQCSTFACVLIGDPWVATPCHFPLGNFIRVSVHRS
jgi:hypothetical protein